MKPVARQPACEEGRAGHEAAVVAAPSAHQRQHVVRRARVLPAAGGAGARTTPGSYTLPNVGRVLKGGQLPPLRSPLVSAELGGAHRDAAPSERLATASPMSMSRTNQWRGWVSLQGEEGWERAPAPAPLLPRPRRSIGSSEALRCRPRWTGGAQGHGDPWWVRPSD